MDEILDIEDLATYLKMKKASVYNLVERGDIPFYRIGRLLRFRKSQIDEWLESLKVETITSDKSNKQAIKNVGPAERIDLDRIVKKAIDERRGLRYPPRPRENQPDSYPDRRGKEVLDV